MSYPQRGGGGRGGYGGRGGGGGRGPRPSWHREREHLEHNGLPVSMNCFRVSFVQEGLTELFQYRVDITTLVKKRRDGPPPEVGRGGPPPPDEEVVWEELVGRTTFDSRVKNPPPDGGNDSMGLSRQILLQLQADLQAQGQKVFTDGSSLAYSYKLLVSEEDGNPLSKRPRLEEEMTTERKSKLPPIVFTVQLEGQRSKKYKVQFRVTKTIRFRVQYGPARGEQSIVLEDPEQWQSLQAFVNIVLKNKLLMETQSQAMVCFGRSPRVFYQMRDNLSLQKFNDYLRNRAPHLDAMTGLQQAAIGQLSGPQGSSGSSSHLKFLLTANFKVDWFYAEGRPVLDVANRKLAGIPIRDLHQVVPEHDRGAILKALASMYYHVKYTCGPRWKENAKKQGRSDEWIHKRTTFETKNMRPASGPIIEWDPSNHRFEFQGKFVTEREYFRERYDISLQYPNMPLLGFPGRQKTVTIYFPVEFLFQARTVLRRDTDNDRKSLVLHASDTFAGPKRIGKISDIVMRHLGNDLERLNLRIDSGPVKQNAKVLRPPELYFQIQNKTIEDGKWDLRDVKFSKPASIGSFAVIYYRSPKSIDNIAKAKDFMKILIESCENHGMILPVGAKESIESDSVFLAPRDGLTEYNCNHRLRDDFIAVQELCRKYYFHTFVTEKNFGIPFRTYAWKNTESGRGKAVECMVVLNTENDDYVDLIAPNGNKGQWQVTHAVVPRGESKEMESRMKFQLTVKGQTRLFDPFDVRVVQTPRGRQIEAKVDEQWQDAGTSVKECYEVSPSKTYNKHDLQSIRALIRHEVRYVDCPSVVFVLKPDKDTTTYSRIKFISRFLGIQTQVIAMEAVSGQKGKPLQYCSNVALKVNTKLSSRMHMSSAWTFNATSGSSWIQNHEQPTLLIGISSASGMGESAKMVVIGTACLYPSGLAMGQDGCIQKKSPLLSESALEEIVSKLYHLYVYSNNHKPKRLIIFRESGQEGFFESIKDREIPAVKKAIKDEDCSIFFVVAQSNHSIRVAPADQSKDLNNVPSGTCLELEDGGFLLVAQGGLKGTSKPMYYRLIYEPENHTNQRLDPQTLQNLTYALSFQYGTATKSTRFPALLNYSSRLANTVLGYMEDLFTEGPDRLKFKQELEDEDDVYRREDGTSSVMPFCSSFYPQISA